MPETINVRFLPDLAAPDAFAGTTAVVIDVLRASTTMLAALAAGAAGIVPCLHVEEARSLAADQQGTLLGGERGGLKIEGFDFGNSPAEYTVESVRGRTIAFTTTNGTRALQRCASAEQVLIGSFVNLTALCRALRSCRTIELVCAGTNGQVTREDVLFAGAVVAQMNTTDGSLSHNDEAQLAEAAWRQVEAQLEAGTPFAQCLEQTRGGRNLLRTGQGSDIRLAAAIDRFGLVPELSRQDWIVR